jgi:hypothetical protein
MAGTHPNNLTYGELYSDPANNPFGTSEEDLEGSTRAVYQMCWRLPDNPKPSRLIKDY